MNFKTGQKVVCVNDSFISYCAYPIRKAVVYTVAGFYRCACGSNQVTLAERPCTINMICRCNRISNRMQSYYDWRFMPLDFLDNIIELPAVNKETKEAATPQDQEIMNEIMNQLVDSMEPDLKTVLCDEWQYYYSN